MLAVCDAKSDRASRALVRAIGRACIPRKSRVANARLAQIYTSRRRDATRRDVRLWCYDRGMSRENAYRETRSHIADSGPNAGAKGAHLLATGESQPRIVQSRVPLWHNARLEGRACHVLLRHGFLPTLQLHQDSIYRSLYFIMDSGGDADTNNINLLSFFLFSRDALELVY